MLVNLVLYSEGVLYSECPLTEVPLYSLPPPPLPPLPHLAAEVVMMLMDPMSFAKQALEDLAEGLVSYYCTVWLIKSFILSL